MAVISVEPEQRACTPTLTKANTLSAIGIHENQGRGKLLVNRPIVKSTSHFRHTLGRNVMAVIKLQKKKKPLSKSFLMLHVSYVGGRTEILRALTTNMTVMIYTSFIPKMFVTYNLPLLIT